MACPTLTQGFTPKLCKTPSGTIEFMIAEHSFCTVTITSGVVSAIAMTSGKQFFRYKQKPEVANWKETPTIDAKSGAYKYTADLIFDMNSLDSSTKIEAENLMQLTSMVISKDADGTYWLIGNSNGVDFTPATDGGIEYSSFRGIKMTGQSIDFLPVASVPANLIAALLLPASP